MTHKNLANLSFPSWHDHDSLLYVFNYCLFNISIVQATTSCVQSNNAAAVQHGKKEKNGDCYHDYIALAFEQNMQSAGLISHRLPSHEAHRCLEDVW